MSNKTQLTELAAAFEREVVDDALWVERHYHYPPHYFLSAVAARGAVGAARYFAHQEGISSGLQRLYEMGLLAHTVEAIMLKPVYASLFSAEEMDLAHRKLKDLGYRAPWDTRED